MNKNFTKSKIKLTCCLLSLLCAFSLLFFNANTTKIASARIDNTNIECYGKKNVGQSAIVIDSLSNRVLYGENINTKKFMASTTKILTALVVIENCDLDEIVTIKKEMVGIEGSSIYLEEGEKLSVRDLLYGLMLCSGNDCAVALAIHCSGSISEFANLMNNTAKRTGAKNSNFVNPHGLHSDNHYTTAYDLAIISSCAMKNKEFRKIVSTKNIEIPFTTRNYNRRLKNKNKLLWNFDGANGIKTGYTKSAGRCLVASCVKNGMQLISVVLNCQPMFEKSQQILLNCFENYKYRFLASKNNFVGFSTFDGQQIGLYIKNNIVVPMTDQEYKDIKVEYDYPSVLENRLKKDSEIGKIKIYSKNNLLFMEKIYTII